MRKGAAYTLPRNNEVSCRNAMLITRNDLMNIQLTRGWKEIQRHCPRRIGWRCRLGGGSSPSRGSRPSCDSLLCSSLSFLSSFLSLSFLSLFFSSISKSEKFNLSAEWIIHGYTCGGRNDRYFSRIRNGAWWWRMHLARVFLYSTTTRQVFEKRLE